MRTKLDFWKNKIEFRTLKTALKIEHTQSSTEDLGEFQFKKPKMIKNSNQIQFQTEELDKTGIKTYRKHWRQNISSFKFIDINETWTHNH